MINTTCPHPAHTVYIGQHWMGCACSSDKTPTTWHVTDRPAPIHLNR